MANVVDVLNKKIKETKAPIVVGLDPVLGEIPDCYKEKYSNMENKFEAIANILFDFNKDIIDVACKLVPAVKPQIAFYEMYGSWGMIAFEKTVKYAKEKGLIVIGDAKRNDIGNTAAAYAKAFLGKVDVGSGVEVPSYDVDFLTVSPYLGSDSLDPFISECEKNGKGVFILVKTSNPKSGDIQDKVDENGNKIYENIATYIEKESEKFETETGYSPIGAVVGATYPEQSIGLRKIMKKNIFLVPGYGAQGASASDICGNFNEDGLGAIVNSSRGIIFAYKKVCDKAVCTKEQYMESVEKAIDSMKTEILNALAQKGINY
ncbi:MAG: orotidine-5'-phosphate decarboxylase [Lachnospiraceae bacterium]|jgi:orotidine-5'-phosphate decarboxylase|nr:orotidine-5'-phosphate decarboxylase [Lachnospiraceae bacterium]